ncbi:hypothetical protein ACFYQA_02320 [Streptomyces sp. NPDC005774]|uniref:hypothetical protein n=1 Tax=Streptomyces sp. NPDC005774 TaxID=3364728 RepID=UPI0036C62239
MTDHVARPERAATSRRERVAELQRLAREDYDSNASLHASNVGEPLFGTAADAVRNQLREPTDLQVAIRVAQQLLDSDNVLSLQEALRLLLRAHDAEPATRPAVVEPPAVRCPAAHPEDPTPCGGPVVVTILDRGNAGANGCEYHGARLLASLDGGRVYPLPDAPEQAAIRVFKAADTTRPFAWVDAPRTRPDQLSTEENRRRGEGQ